MPNDRQVNALEIHRRARSLSRERLAAEAGVSLRTVERLERGEVTTPHRATARVLAVVLEANVEDLFPGSEEMLAS